MTQNLAISVVLSVYNAEIYVREAVNRTNKSYEFK